MLSKAKLDAAKPRTSAYRLWDNNRTGFGARVTPAGAITFFQHYRIDGKRRFYNLGRYPDTKLADARYAAQKKVRDIVAQGRDPIEVEAEEHRERERKKAEAERQQQAEARRGSIEQLIEAHVAKIAKRRTHKYVHDVDQTLRRFLPDDLRAQKVADIKPDQLADVIAVPIRAGHPVMANRLRSYLHAMFQTALKHDHDPANRDRPVTFGLEHNPVSAIPAQEGVEGARDRELSFDEVGRIWNALTDPACPGSPIMKAELRLQLLLAGMHFTEVGHARWSEINFMRQIWDIPARRDGNLAGTKNGRPHVLPLCDTALAELQELHRLTGHTEWLFPNVRDEAAHRADPEVLIRPMAEASPSQFIRVTLRPWMDKRDKAEKREPLAKWVAANFRSTVKTRLGELGFNSEQRNRLQNHNQQGVAVQHYDRWDFLDEKREMLEAWERAIEKAAAGEHIDPAAIRRDGRQGAA